MAVVYHPKPRSGASWHHYSMVRVKVHLWLGDMGSQFRTIMSVWSALTLLYFFFCQKVSKGWKRRSTESLRSITLFIFELLASFSYGGLVGHSLRMKKSNVFFNFLPQQIKEKHDISIFSTKRTQPVRLKVEPPFCCEKGRLIIGKKSSSRKLPDVNKDER